MSTAAANILGMRSILLLRADRDWGWQGNLLIDRLLGAEVRFIDDERASHGQRGDGSGAARDGRRGPAGGQRPYVMNHSGAFAVGSALAYLLCSLEIVEQAAPLGLEPTHLYMASGTRATPD